MNKLPYISIFLLVSTIFIASFGIASANEAPVWVRPSSQSVSVGDEISLTLSVYDPEGRYLTVTAINIPAGSYFSPTFRYFTWTPQIKQTGNFLATFRASDGISTSDMSININVNGGTSSSNGSVGGGAPIWIQTGGKTAIVGKTLQFTVSASDPDGGFLSYRALNLPLGASFNSVSRLLSWTPSFNQLGTYTVTFVVDDGLYSMNMPIVITVINDPSQLNTQATGLYFSNFNPPTIAVEGQQYSYIVKAIDSDNNPIIYNLLTNPIGMVIDQTTGFINWTPNATQGRQTPYAVVVEAEADGISITQNYLLTVLDPSAQINTTQTSPGIPVAPLKISDIDVQVEENGDVTVSWKTNKQATARVIYDTKSQADKTKDFSYENATNETSISATSQKILLTDLKDGKQYYLRAVAKRTGEVAISEEQTITLAGDPASRLASVIGIFGDFLISPWFLFPLILLLAFLLFRAKRSTI